MKRKNITIVLVGLMFLSVAFLPVLAIPTVAEANPGEDYGIISVYGEAEITAQPDLAQVMLAVETTHELAQKAAEENARLTNTVIEALAKTGLEEKQIKTSGYRLYSFSEPVDPRQEEKYITKYRAYNELNINLYDLDGVGNVIDIAVKAGANRVLGVLFEIKDAESLKLQALQNATTQAKTKAEAIASSAGVTIKGIKVIQEEMTGYSPYRATMDVAAFNEGAKGMAPTPILPDDVEITARIKAEYYF